MHLSLDENDITSTDPRRLQMVRAAAYFLLHSIGDIKEDEPPVVPAAENVSTKPSVPPTALAPVFNIPPPPPPPPAPRSESGDAGDEDDETGESNVVNFPTAGASTSTPPPPPLVAIAVPPPSILGPNLANTVAAAPGAASVLTGGQPLTVNAVEYDAAGMPWDARIHQKGKSKKKDGTWKLQKGIDTGIVQAVTAELASRKLGLGVGAAPTVASPVSLPPAANTVPMPPVANVPAPPGVPAPPAEASAPVPVPPSPAAGPLGAYRALIDKITELTQAGKVTPVKISEICQSHGAPSLMALNSMQHLIADIGKSIDAAALGLL
jgi:hypothetical protein